MKTFKTLLLTALTLSFMVIGPLFRGPQWQ